ncbi:MAG: HNH endonuclease signature motif containing protein [Peptococcaceae bacterium]|nr:HNH endonuclease signature motif containing protein [Peptococcaceae bacterium]
MEVRRLLRKEVRFGCPIPGCGNPYLAWHHFDPTWSELEHHNPSGMIALCAEHHAKADAGAFTKEQLRGFKESGAQQIGAIRGRFDWMRNGLLAIVGGNFYFETPVILEFRGKPVIWFRRDDDGYFLLNAQMLTTSKEPRARIQDNFWLSQANPDDLECPSSGKLLKIKYSNGDELRIEFLELESGTVVKKRYPGVMADRWGIEFPITGVEIHKKVGGTELEFGPRETTLPGRNIMRNCFSRGCQVGLSIR